MSVSNSNLETTRRLENARAQVLLWIREAHRNPLFLQESEAPEQIEQADAKIVERFVSWATPAGFNFTLEQTAEGQFVVHWTHCGYNFVGFRQPPPAEMPDEAKLLACAALLDNGWCRERLP
jgi:hypothetical protein